MSSAEIVSAGAIPARERIETVEVQEAVASPARPADAELTLRAFELYTPTEPLSINGQPYNVSIDQEKLTTAINRVAEHTVTGTSDLYPRQLNVATSVGQSQVKIGEDLQPKITDPKGSKKTPILTTFEGGGTSLNITLPSELASAEYSEAGLVELVTRQANKDLFVALSQNYKAKYKFHFGLRMSSLMLAAGVGEGVGIATSDHWLEMLGRGTGGAFAGGAIAVASVLAVDRLKWGNLEKFNAWSVSKSREYQKIHWWLEKLAKESPIISLSAVQSEQPEAFSSS